jgi:hypothetical protein
MTVEVPYRAEVDQSVAESSTWMLVRSVPRVVAAMLLQAWRIAPGLTALAGVLQLASGVASAFGLLATAGVLTQLLEAGAHPEQVVRALPAFRGLHHRGPARRAGEPGGGGGHRRPAASGAGAGRVPSGDPACLGRHPGS